MKGAAVLLFLVAIAGCIQDSTPTKPPATSDARVPDVIGRDLLTITTELGDVTVLLYPEAAPLTLDLYRDYVKEAYYTNREFLRVVPGHVIQISDRAGGATDDARRVPLETNPEFHFSAGAVGIARDTDPNSGGPEFFIMDYATSHLDGNYTVWGQVISGLDVVHRIARVPSVSTAGTPLSALYFDRFAVDGVAIRSMRIQEGELTAAALAPYPMAVAKNVRVGEFRHSADYPRNLAANASNPLTWYIRGYNDTAPPSAASVQVRVENQTLPVEGDPTAEGAYHWAWTPSRPGSHEATVLVDGKEWATLVIPVPANAPAPYFSS